MKMMGLKVGQLTRQSVVGNGDGGGGGGRSGVVVVVVAGVGVAVFALDDTIVCSLFVLIFCLIDVCCCCCCCCCWGRSVCL